MATPNTTVNYEDKRFQKVEADKKAALTEAEKTYGGMINQTDKFYNAQINASKQWADKQTQLQQERSDFAIEQIEQQKEQAEKDYKKEQSGAYVDWQKESNRYGANAEQMASQGFGNTGYSESSQVRIFNNYQQRVVSARESFQNIILNYNNAIKDARLQNNSALAEIALNAQKEQLQLLMDGFHYKNDLIIQKANKKTELDEIYHGRYQDVLQQINTENAMAEEIRQFNKEYELKNKEYQEGIRQFNAEIARLKAKDAQEYKLEIQNLELQKKKLQEEQRQFNAQMAEEKRQFNASQKSSKSSGSSGGSIKKSSSSSSSSKKSSGSSSSSKITNSSGGGSKGSVSAYTYLNKLISSGASKDKVSNEIALALRNGAITAKEAQKLRSTFTPRGLQY